MPDSPTGYEQLTKELDDIRSDIHSKAMMHRPKTLSCMPETDKQERSTLTSVQDDSTVSETVDSQCIDRPFRKSNSHVKVKKRVVMISPTRTNSLFPDLESTISQEVHKHTPRMNIGKAYKAPLGILKVNTKIPLDFKKDHMGVLYSSILEDSHATMAAEMEKKDFERCERWDEMMSQHSQGWDAVWEDRIWKGVPHSYRKNVWNEILSINSGFYSNLSQDQKKWVNMELLKKFKDIKSWDLSDTTFSKEIERDAQVTLPRHVTFQGSEGKQILQLVLNVLSIHNYQIGYVHGMNLWIGLLMTLFPDDLVFFFSQKLLYDKPRRDSFTSFYGLNRLYLKDEAFFDCTVFIHSRLLALWFPKIQDHLENFGLFPSLYLKKWLFSLFVGCSAVSYPLSTYKNSNGGLLSWPTVLRIWDLYLFYGWDILIIVSISILKYYSKEILKMDPATLMVFFGIEDGSMESHGVATDSLPFISNPDKFIDLVQSLYLAGKRHRLSILGDYHSSRISIDSISSISSDSKALRGMSGKQLVNFFKNSARDH